MDPFSFEFLDHDPRSNTDPDPGVKGALYFEIKDQCEQFKIAKKN